MSNKINLTAAQFFELKNDKWPQPTIEQWQHFKELKSIKPIDQQWFEYLDKVKRHINKNNQKNNTI